MFYVYILKSSKKENWLYTGYSTNLKQRLKEHQQGRVDSTKNYRPLEIVFYEAYKAEGDAKRREEYFKTTRGKRALKLMLKDSLK